MHMADALVSPAIGAGSFAVTGALIVHCSRRISREMDDRKVPLMGVVAAFVFAAQMINIAIPGTGSSGHLGGGLLLAVLLGPHAGFLTMASVLIVQALFFADGGLLALGCNIFNLGFFPCFVAYPLLFKPLAGSCRSRWRIVAGCLAGAIVGLQLGSAAVVAQTVLSRITELPALPFLFVMQPIHLAIGVIEGVATAAVVLFVWRERPEILDAAVPGSRRRSFVEVTLVLAAAAVLIGGGFSWFASKQPDGLEWSIASVTEAESLQEPEGDGRSAIVEGAGTAGLIGGGLTLLVVGLTGLALKRGGRKGSHDQN